MPVRQAIMAIACMLVMQVMAIDASNRYRSPRNPERKPRRSTGLIVLHTTEAPARSSLNKLSERGEAHFCVTEEGQVFRIVDLNLEAFHAGRSMWNASEDVDKYSVGIECVGYHNKQMPTVQLTAIRNLVKELQVIYNLPDEKVVAHSHVAYGAPNKWQKFKHRGRKRCGMLFAMPSVRRMLQLKARPAFDPDTRAGRLTVGDEYLNSVLYARVDTMAGVYGQGVPTPALPPAPRVPSPATPPPAKAAVAKKPTPPSRPKSVAKAASKTSAPPKTVAQLQARGWDLRGFVSKKSSAMSIAGKKWNAADTYYVIRDKVIPGNQIKASRIEKGMGIWMKK